MFNVDGDDIVTQSFNSSASLVSDLSISDYDYGLNLSIRQYIECMQISQQHTVVMNDRNSNKNQLDNLCKVVDQVQSGGNPPVILVQVNKIGHALVGYKLEGNRLYVYDCNYPYTERFISLTQDSTGKYISWYYSINDTYPCGTNYSGSYISYVPYSDYAYTWSNRPKETSSNLLSTKLENLIIKGQSGRELARLEKGELKSTDSSIFLMETSDISSEGLVSGDRPNIIVLPSGQYTIEQPDESTRSMYVSMVNYDLGAEVTTSSKKVTFDVNDNSSMDKITIDTGKGDDYAIILKSTAPSDHSVVEVSGISKGGIVTVSQSDGNIYTENCEGATVSINGQSSYKIETARISLNVSGTLPIKVGQKYNGIKVTDIASNDSIVSWKSSKPKIVTVSKKGVIKGRKIGKAKITVTTARGASYSFKVKVQKKAVTTKKIVLSQKKITLTKGKKYRISMTLSPVTTQDKVSFTSSDKKVVTVSSKGVIKARGKGKATVYVRSGKMISKLKVKVKRK